MTRIIPVASAIRLAYKLTPSGLFSLVSRSSAQYLRENDKGGRPTCQSRQTSPEEKSESIKRGWGALGVKEQMTSRQAKRLRDRVAGIEAWYGKENCRFFTGTLPSVDPKAFRALAEWSSWLVDRMGKWIKAQLGLDSARCFVWEYQKRGALHLHAIIGAATIPQQFAKKLKFQWINCLLLIGQKTGADMFRGKRGQNFLKFQHKIRARTEKLKKSAVAYLSKYLSKSSHSSNKALHGCNQKGVFYPVPSWCQWDRKATECWLKTSHAGILGFCTQEIWEIIKKGGMAIAEKYKQKNTKVMAHEKFYSSGINAIISTEKISEFLSEIQAISVYCLEDSVTINPISLDEQISIYRKQLELESYWVEECRKHDCRVNAFLQENYPTEDTCAYEEVQPYQLNLFLKRDII